MISFYFFIFISIICQCVRYVLCMCVHCTLDMIICGIRLACGACVLDFDVIFQTERMHINLSYGESITSMVPTGKVHRFGKYPQYIFNEHSDT